MARRLVSAIRTRAPVVAGRGNVFVVVVVDPQTAEVDVYGPCTAPDATAEAREIRSDLDADGSGYADVVVGVVPLHPDTADCVAASSRRTTVSGG